MAFFHRLFICVFFLLLLVSVSHLQAVGERTWAKKEAITKETCSVQNEMFSIEENNPPGMVITDVRAAAGVTVTIDPQPGTNFHWFEMKDLQLILKYSVDYENTTVLLVFLKCTGAGMPETVLNIVVTIVNLNDNPPVFSHTNMTVHVNEDTKVNTVIVPQANVTATDADLDVIYYSLTGNPTEATTYFNIQGVNNPQISLRKALDYEQINFMVLTLYAMDGIASEVGTHTATATISIYVLQADLRPPWFQPCTFIGSTNTVCLSHGYRGKINVSEMATEPLILEPGPLYAIDGDKSLNEKIVYEMAGGNEDNTFTVNKDSGNITMNKPVNTLKTFLLYVVASQANNAFRYSQTTVEIEVVHKNEHNPQFEKATYTGTVSVNLPVSSLIMDANTPSVPLQIFAADDDFADRVNPFIKYHIQNNTDFKVTTDGLLLTMVVLKQPATITVLAIATDTMSQQEASTRIVIDVTSPTTVLPTTASSGLPPGAQPTTPPASTTGNTGTTGITPKPDTVPTSSSGTPPFVTSVKPPNITGTNQSPVVTAEPTADTGKPTAGTSKPTADTGKPTADTGKPTAGTGKPTVNTGKPTAGTGKPTADTGKPTAGTGKPTAGTGKPTADTGKPTVDTGKPTADTGKPTADTGKPTAGTGKPTADTGKPTADTGKPTVDTGKPTVDTGKPTAGTSKPTVDTGKPTADTGKPTADTGKPTAGTGKPTVDTGKPTADPGKPTAATGKPTAGTGKPTVDTGKPTAGTGKPSTEAGVLTPRMYTVQDMTALGVTLGCLLAIALVLLGLVSYRYYMVKRGSCKFEGFVNTNFQNDEKFDSDGKGSLLSASIASMSSFPDTLAPLGKSLAERAFDAIPEKAEKDEETDSSKEVRSILTKDRRMSDNGYKAVWFKEDIDPEAKDDVLVIEDDNDVEPHMSNAAEDNDSDQDSESSDDDSGVHITPGEAQVQGADPPAIQLSWDIEARSIDL